MGFDIPVWESLFQPQKTSAEGRKKLECLYQPYGGAPAYLHCLGERCGGRRVRQCHQQTWGHGGGRGGRRSTANTIWEYMGENLRTPRYTKGERTTEEDAEAHPLLRSERGSCQNLNVICSHLLVCAENIWIDLVTNSLREEVKILGETALK